MASIQMYDASTPPRDPPPWPVVAGYIGGNTPYVWSAQDWDQQPAPLRLPIFTRSNPGNHDPAVDATTALLRLRELGAPKSCTVALDFETAIHPLYVQEFDLALSGAGYEVMLYGSKGTVFSNPRPLGGYWVADWTGKPHMVSGSAVKATQWSGSGPFGGAYDASLIFDSVPLWEAGMSQADVDAINSHTDDIYKLLARAETTKGHDPAHDSQSVLGVFNAVDKISQAIAAGMTIDYNALADALIAKAQAAGITITINVA